MAAAVRKAIRSAPKQTPTTTPSKKPNQNILDRLQVFATCAGLAIEGTGDGLRIGQTDKDFKIFIGAIEAVVIHVAHRFSANRLPTLGGLME
jgi:hypothetical protein